MKGGIDTWQITNDVGLRKYTCTSSVPSLISKIMRWGEMNFSMRFSEMIVEKVEKGRE